MLGIIIVDHGSRRRESNEMFEEIVRRFQERHGYKIAEAAHMELASPTVEEAFDRAVELGADEIVVHPYFLLPGRHWNEDIPGLAAKAAAKHPGVKWKITEPLGQSEKMLEVIEERIQKAVSEDD